MQHVYLNIYISRYKYISKNRSTKMYLHVCLDDDIKTHFCKTAWAITKKQHVQDFDSYRLKDRRQRRPSSNLTTTLYESNLWDAQPDAIKRSTPIHAKWCLDQMPLRGVRPDVFHFNAAIAVHATTIESLFIEDTLSSSTKHSIHNPISNSSRKCNPRTRSIDQPY